LELHFLGTGASGGTPGRGRSRRRESSLLVSAGVRVLIDVTTFFSEQVRAVDEIDAVLLTHAHKDAAGGMSQLRSWCREREREAVPIYAAARTVDHLKGRFRRLDHCDFRIARPGQALRIGELRVRGVEVPHAREERFPTFAWRLSQRGKALVYASDVGELTPRLGRACHGASLLVLDGAMWRRRIFSHLTIDDALPAVCGWQVERVLLTQIGRTAPPHERLRREAARICPKAAPAYDGMRVKL
jgi:phosphoribosyl 1,2-cyclic phosphodiesterase